MSHGFFAGPATRPRKTTSNAYCGPVACRSLLLDLQNRGNYFKPSRDLCKRLGFAPGCLLAHLLNFAQAKADGAGWFQCSTVFLDNVGMEANEQRATLTILQRAGVIDIEQRDDGRYVRVIVSKVREVMNDDR